MNTIYVHTLGDSTLDNLYWMLGSGSDNGSDCGSDNSIVIDTPLAKEESVEGQLEKKLNEHDSAYQVISHAYDGFTTSSVLNGDRVGRVLNIYPGMLVTKEKEAYLNGKKMSACSPNYFVHPLNDLKSKIVKHANETHYVVISVGGNDFRERLLNPIGMLMELPKVHERYLRIMKEVKSLKAKDIRPILMFQYRLDTQHDNYGIYKILKVVGAFFVIVNSLIFLSLSVSSISLMASAIDRNSRLLFILIGATFLYLSHRVLPLKVTKNILFDEHSVSMATLGGLLETFYRPILEQAKVDRIPILDLSNAFNPNDTDLYVAQIEPSQKGGELIANGVDHIIKNHDFKSSKSLIYSKAMSHSLFTHTENCGPNHWSVTYPVE